MGEEGLKLVGYWGSPYTLRVHWALKLKGIEYDYQEEDLPDKSPLLLQYNPVYKKVPVLVHNGKPIAESLVILEYIDETWKQYPLLPEDSYGKSKARFWAKFADEKCVPAIMGTFSSKGDEQAKFAKEARENLKILESGLEGKRCFGVEKLGYTDIAVAWIGIWGRIVEEIVGIKLIDEENMPVLTAWFENVLETPSIKECIPPIDKLKKHNKGFYEMLQSAAAT